MISNEVLRILSLKKVTAENIDSRISKIEGRIKNDIDSVFTDVEVGRNVGEDLINLSNYKDAKLLMNKQSYKIYEKEGKEMPYEDYLAEWHKSL